MLSENVRKLLKQKRGEVSALFLVFKVDTKKNPLRMKRILK